MECRCVACEQWRTLGGDKPVHDKHEARYAAREADRLLVPEPERMAFIAGWMARAEVK